MSAEQKAALLDFVRAGHGFVGVHSATDTFTIGPTTARSMIGGFSMVIWHQSVRIERYRPSDALVSFLGRAFQIKDEIYQIRDFDEQGSRVLPAS
jgi:type 1 glutamine amidotransferase